VKIADEVSVQGLAIRVDYCGRCGRNWPRDLAARVPADGDPPRDPDPTPPQPQPPIVIPPPEFPPPHIPEQGSDE